MNFIDLTKEIPDYHQPCEYQIIITCKGWFQPEDGKSNFVPSSITPHAKLVSWRPWDEGEAWEDKKAQLPEVTHDL